MKLKCNIEQLKYKLFADTLIWNDVADLNAR